MIQSFSSFAVSNKAFTNQMLGQQLLILLGKELGTSLSWYYKYHKLAVFSCDSHLNHQIFISKAHLIETLIQKTQKIFGIKITIKDIITIARSVRDDNEGVIDVDIAELTMTDRYDGEDL